MFRLSLVSLSLLFTGCTTISGLGHIPASATIYEEKQAIIAKTIKLPGQSLVEGQPLTKWQFDGKLIYCSDMFSGDLTLYRCFSFEGENLVAGMNPQSFELEPLKEPVPFRFVDK